jgi:F-type H+-transporting ATPase subunit a
MPEHTSFLSYLLAMFPALGENMHNFGETFIGHKPVDSHGAEPFAASALVALIIVFLAWRAKVAVSDYEKSVLPDEKLSLRTFFEIFIGYFYGMMKDMMGPTRAKKYFPVIGTAACFVFFGNFLGMFPGFLPPTSSWNITAGCSLVVIASFIIYGFQSQGMGMLTHLAGPYMGPLLIPVNILIFVIEFVSTFIIRPITLSFRLMLNMAVDHLLLSISLSIAVLFLPLPIMLLGTLVCIVQCLVFCLLGSIYIALATEGHGDHDHGHGHDEAHGEKAHAH